MACSEANRWRFETQRGHGTIISTTLPTSHTISMHTCWSTNRELQRKRERERRRVRRFCSTKEYTKWTCFFFSLKISTTRGQDRLQTRKKNILHQTKYLLNKYRKERDRCKKRETSDSYIQVTSKDFFFLFCAMFFRQLFKFYQWLYERHKWLTGCQTQSTGQQDIDYAWLGQFV